VDRRQYPSLETVLEESEGRVVVARVYSVETDAYLADAQLAGRRCVPAAMAWEAMAEAAELVLGGAQLTAAEELRCAGALLLDAGGRCDVVIEAVRSAPERAQVTLSMRGPRGVRQVRFGGEFTSARTPPAPVPRSALRSLDRRARERNGHTLSAAQDEQVQLGETLGGCVWARTVSFCELVGGIRAETDRLFYGVDTPRLALNPALLECALMLAGFGWYALAQQSGVPVDVERVELGQPADPDAELLCHVRLRATTPTTVTADLVVIDAEQRLVMAVRGCRLMLVERMVDVDAAKDEAGGSWARFCRALQGPAGGAG
jgi:hypothetical protein